MTLFSVSSIIKRVQIVLFDMAEKILNAFSMVIYMFLLLEKFQGEYRLNKLVESGFDIVERVEVMGVFSVLFKNLDL